VLVAQRSQPIERGKTKTLNPGNKVPAAVRSVGGLNYEPALGCF